MSKKNILNKILTDDEKNFSININSSEEELLVDSIKGKVEQVYDKNIDKLPYLYLKFSTNIGDYIEELDNFSKNERQAVNIGCFQIASYLGKEGTV